MKDINPHIVWASVVLALGVIAAAVWLLQHDKDVTALLALVNLAVLPIIIALGSRLTGKLDKVEQNSNGNLTRMLALFAQTHPQVPTATAQQIMDQADPGNVTHLPPPPAPPQDMPKAA